MEQHEVMRMFCEPISIEERRLRAIEAYAFRVLAGEEHRCTEALAGAGIRPPTTIVAAGNSQGGNVPGAEYDLVGSCAIVHVWGVLDKKDPTSKGKRVGTGYERVAATMEAARHDDRVGVILLNIDSPGGAVRGIHIGGDAIFNSAESGRQGGKPVVAYTGDLMASAALWLGSQADRVYAGPGAWVGSLGVRLATVDYSAYLERQGIKVNTIKSGEFKDLGNPYRAMTDRDRAKLQAEVDEYFGMFKDAVAKGRRLSSERVNAIATGEGFIGKLAVDAGLVDAIRGSVSELAVELSDKHPVPASPQGKGSGRGGARNSAKGLTMEPKEVADKSGSTTGTKDGAGDAGATALADGQAISIEVARQIKANQDRIAGIHSECQPYINHEGVMALRDKSVLDLGATVSSVKAALLPIVAAALAPVGAADISMGATQWEKEKSACTTMLISRMDAGLADVMQADDAKARKIASIMGLESPKAYVDSLRQARANGFGHMRLMDLAERSARMALGGTRQVFGDRNQIIAIAFGHSSSDFSFLMQTAGNRILLRYFAEALTTWKQWCAQGSASDFKPLEMGVLSELQNLLLVPEGKPLSEATYNERKTAIQLFTYGRKMSVSREALINDDLGGITEQWKLWGITAARLPEMLAIARLESNPTMPDGTTMFHSTRGNLGTGGGSALSRANIIAASKVMMKAKGFGKDKAPLMVEPKNLLIPIDQWDVAWECLRSVFDPTRTNTNSNVPNSVTALGLNDPIKSAYLGSTTAWYLLGDPNIAPAIQVNFLDGNQSPTITQVGNGSIRGVEFEIIFDVGTGARNFEGAYKADGA